MPHREQPMDQVPAPPRYPEPDWTADALVAQVFVPGDDVVGWLVRQGDALAFLSAVGPDSLGAPLRWTIESLLREGAFDARPADEVWQAALLVGPIIGPGVRPLPGLIAEARSLWGL